MFHHVELFRLEQGVPIGDVRAGFEALGELVESLPGTEYFTVTENIVEPHEGWSMVLFSAFSDRRARDIYARHPLRHQIWEEQLAHVVAERKIVAGGDGSGRTG